MMRKWKQRKSTWNKLWFQCLKVAEIVVAALIPFIAGYTDVALLGVFIVVLEGSLGLYQFQDNWISYRSISEALKHEMGKVEKKAAV